MGHHKSRRRQKLTKRVVDAALPEPKRYVIWDSVIPGFGLSVTATNKSFILRYRPGRAGRMAPKRFITIGRFGATTADQARQRAIELLGDVAKGNDPAAAIQSNRSALTVEDAAQEFLKTHVISKRKPTTYALYKQAVDKKIIPAVGRRKLYALTQAEVVRLHHSLRETPFMANRVLAVLGAIYSWASRCGEIADGLNPTRRIEKFREQRRERFLTIEEFARLGATLREAETIGIPYAVDETRAKAKHAPKPENRCVVIAPDAIAAIRLLLLTGCRLREVLHLQWAEVDFGRSLLLLNDSKTGRKAVLLSPAALEVLRSLPKVGHYVFPGTSADKPRSDLKRPWAAIRRRAALRGVRLHDLRHSYASVAAGVGLGLPIIGKLLGHTQPATTARYAHLGDDPLREASSIVSGIIAAAIESQQATKDEPHEVERSSSLPRNTHGRPVDRTKASIRSAG